MVLGKVENVFAARAFGGLGQNKNVSVVFVENAAVCDGSHDDFVKVGNERAGVQVVEVGAAGCVVHLCLSCFALFRPSVQRMS